MKKRFPKTIFLLFIACMGFLFIQRLNTNVCNNPSYILRPNYPNTVAQGIIGRYGGFPKETFDQFDKNSDTITFIFHPVKNWDVISSSAQNIPKQRIFDDDPFYRETIIFDVLYEDGDHKLATYQGGNVGFVTCPFTFVMGSWPATKMTISDP